MDENEYMPDSSIKDKMENLMGAQIQHGPLNRRIYLMKIGDADPVWLPEELRRFAKERDYTKVFAKVPKGDASEFLKAGYVEEAVIPRYYNRTEDASFLGLFIDPERGIAENRDELERVLAVAESRRGKGGRKELRADAVIRPCAEEDADAMSRIYKEVFPTYPFPIDNPDYLLETMRTNVAYFGVEIGGKLVSLSSAEMDEEGSTAEMTDFATLPAWIGHGFAVHLLRRMEEEMRRRGIATAYTIARAVSAGMNITFAKRGYNFAGCLVNNTNISGEIESMNVWYKGL